MTGAIVGVVGGGSLLLLIIYGWRMMVRSDLEKATVLQGLVGGALDLRLAFAARVSVVEAQWQHVVFLRLQNGNIVVRDRDSDERVYPIEAVLEIRQGDRVWGPWAANRRRVRGALVGSAFIAGLVALVAIGELRSGWLQLGASLLALLTIASALAIVVRRRERREAAERGLGS